eukprot:6096973-Pyramimonas_sp.AAC.1
MMRDPNLNDCTSPQRDCATAWDGVADCNCPIAQPARPVRRAALKRRRKVHLKGTRRSRGGGARADHTMARHIGRTQPHAAHCKQKLSEAPDTV